MGNGSYLVTVLNSTGCTHDLNMTITHAMMAGNRSSINDWMGCLLWISRFFHIRSFNFLKCFFITVNAAAAVVVGLKQMTDDDGLILPTIIGSRRAATTILNSTGCYCRRPYYVDLLLPSVQRFFGLNNLTKRELSAFQTSRLNSLLYVPDHVCIEHLGAQSFGPSTTGPSHLNCLATAGRTSIKE